MIIQFRFNNFCSFRQPASIRLRAAGSKSHPLHAADLPCGPILKTMAIYGPNASGKSQLINALRCCCAIIRRQLPAFPLDKKEGVLLSPPPAPHLLTETLAQSSGEPVSFNIQFFSQGHFFEYGFSLKDGFPQEELLLADGKLMYQKNGEQLLIGKIFHSRVKLASSLVSNGFFLGTFTSHCPAEYAEISSAFQAFFHQGCLFFDNSSLFPAGPSPSMSSLQIREILNQPKAHAFIQEQLHHVGLLLPEKYDSPSTGLSKLILLLYRIYCLSQTGGVLIVDDLTAFLHHNASQYLLRLFQDQQTPPMQLIFTTHDVSFLNRKHFRRDEIAMVCLDDSGFSRLRTLADLRVRSDANFSREYLEGKYGFIPAWEDE